ncbi:MAG TPA: membrane protein insertase YidC [Verrucomicrobiae bacterium]|nr:membrane protein insertase YidC [Verrucomicrobiae bacterium]
MDRKSIFVVILCICLWLGLNQIADKLYPPKTIPAAAVTNSVTVTKSGVITNAPAVSNAAAPAAPVAPVSPISPSAESFIVDTNTAEQLLVVTNAEARYTFTSYGGGLKTIELFKYPETVQRKNTSSADLATLNSHAPAPVLAILDGAAMQGDGIFRLIRTADGVRAEKQLTNGLSIIKEFTLGTNYLLSATVQFQNESTQSLSLPEQHWVAGTATPMNIYDNGARTVGFMWYDGDKTRDTIGSSYFSGRGFMCMTKTPPTEFQAGESNVVWVAMNNQFFSLALMPRDPAVKLVAHEISLPSPPAEELENNSRLVRFPKGYEATLVYPALTLAPKQAVQRHFNLYAGPKEYKTLARIGDRFNNKLDNVMHFGWAGFFSKILLLGMNTIHSVLRVPYGWAIILITVFIKTIFWPLTAASTRSMKRMQTLQPQMKAIAEKYKDDPVKKNQKTMEFMKANKVNPLGGCLPMMLQMPVFFGFFYMISKAIELRGASFLWVTDLSQPDTLFMIPGIHFPFNLLPLIMGGTMLWQAHLTPPSPSMDPMQQKIMRYMPLIFMIFLYNYSAGMALYYTVNNLLTIVQTKITRMNDEPAPAAAAPALTKLPKKKK